MATRRARIKAVASLPVRRKDKQSQNKVVSSENSIDRDSNVSQEITDGKSVTNSHVPAEELPSIQSNKSPNKDLQTKATPSSHVIKNTNKRNSESESDNIELYHTKKQSVLKNIDEKKKETESIVIDGITKIKYPDVSLIDGITPLQTTSKSKPLHVLLNSELISDNAEVVFDPIVPLPTINKMRPKLKPVPRFNPPRRNSIQGSASESEDESRRSMLGRSQTPKRTRHDSQTSHSTVSSLPNREISRVRNDSICSIVSHSTTQNVPSSPKPIKSKRTENLRRINAMKRRQQVLDGGSKDGLTMYDLIFYNPTTNPIINEEDNDEEATLPESTTEDFGQGNEPTFSDIAKEAEDSTPAPQIKIGPDGKIVLDEKSLVIEGTESKRGLSQSIVREKGAVRTGRYTRTPRAADWTAQDTVRFYRALAAVGTDFSMMATLFPKRTRREIKIKFKKEEKINGAQVDRALQSSIPWDLMSLETEFQEQRVAEEAARKASKEVKRSRASRHKETGNMAKSQGASAVNIFRKRISPTVKTPTIDEILSETKTNTNLLTSAKKVKIISKPPIEPTTPNLVTKVTPTKNPTSEVPADIEKGSLVVLAVNDPNAPGKKLLQTYISDDKGNLTTVNLPNNLLSSVAGYIKNSSRNNSPVSSQGRTPPTPAAPRSNRQRNDSYTITPL